MYDLTRLVGSKFVAPKFCQISISQMDDEGEGSGPHMLWDVYCAVDGSLAATSTRKRPSGDLALSCLWFWKDNSWEKRGVLMCMVLTVAHVR